MITIPRGFVLIQQGPATIAVRQSYRDSLLRLGILDPERLLRAEAQGAEGHTGRGAVASIALPGTPEEFMLVRKYRRGGLIRFVNRDLCLRSDRPFRELCVTAEAKDRGIPVPEVLAAATISVAGPLVRGYLFSKELRTCRDLPAWLAHLAGSRPDSFEKQKDALLSRTAAVVRNMHDRGFYHADLNLKNILVDSGDDARLTVIDWDKSCSLNGPLDIPRRTSSVVRLCRSMAKFSRQGLPLTERDRHRLIDCYWHGDQESPERQATRRQLKAALALRVLSWNR